jgi:hypothetical protein
MKPSPTSTSQPNLQPSNPSPTDQPTPEQMQQVMQELIQRHAAVSEALWETIRTLAPDTHEVTVSSHASDPLWDLRFIRVAGPDGKPDPSGRIRICAATIPELTEHDKKRLVRYLRGTDTPLEQALAHFRLEHPVAYVAAKLSDRIRWNPGTPGDEGNAAHWESVTPPDAGERFKNLLHLPK